MSRQSFTNSPKPLLNEIKQKTVSQVSPQENANIIGLTLLAKKLHQQSIQNANSLKVSSSLSYVAYVYEQFRNIIDNKSDHLLRRNAIERILKRLLWENSQTPPSQLAQQLVKELVWSRYIANSSTSVDQLQSETNIIAKYIPVFNKNPLFFSLASAEIEELIDPSLTLTETLCQTMQTWFKGQFTWTDEEISDVDKELILFVAIRKVLIKSDNARISYQLIKSQFPSWENFTASELSDKYSQINKLLISVKSVQSSPIFNKLYRLLAKHTAQFLILKDLIETKPEDAFEIISDKETLDIEIDQLCKARYDQIKKRVATGIIRSVIYIFATKMLFVLLLEIPFELLVAGHLSFTTLLINLALPPLLMILVGLGIQKPDDKNTITIIKRVNELAFPSEKTRQSISLIDRHQNKKSSVVFNFIYTTFAILVFSIIVILLTLLHFNLVGIIVFFLFLSLVLLFGFRVGFAATELYVDSPHKSPFFKVFEQLSLPFLNLGIYLSKGLDQLNFLTTIMDIIFEMPLKTFLDIINRWSDFINNKRAEMVEVPIQ